MVPTRTPPVGRRPGRATTLAAVRPVTWERSAGGVLIALGALVLAVIECFLVVLRAGTTPVPVSIVLAVLVNLSAPWVMVRVTGIRPAGFVPGLLWLVVALVFSSSGPGGDVVVPGDWQGISFLLAGAAAAAIGVVIAVPTHRRRRPPAPGGTAGGSPRVPPPRR